MNDERVDQLLQDLDAALAVEPSPALTAKVRRRIDDAERSTWGASRRWAIATAGVVAAFGAAYLTWPRPVHEPLPADRIAAAEIAHQSPLPPSVQAPEHREELSPRPRIAELPVHSRRAPAEATIRAVVTAAAEPEVIVSPSVRLGLEQLQRGVAAGRITTESFATERVSIEPRMVTPTVIEIKSIALAAVPVESPGAAGVAGDARLLPGELPDPMPVVGSTQTRRTL